MPLLLKAGLRAVKLVVTKDLFSLMLYCVKGKGTVITLVAATILHHK